jgi:hypothetical protein
MSRGSIRPTKNDNWCVTVPDFFCFRLLVLWGLVRTLLGSNKTKQTSKTVSFVSCRHRKNEPFVFSKTLCLWLFCTIIFYNKYIFLCTCSQQFISISYIFRKQRNLIYSLENSEDKLRRIWEPNNKKCIHVLSSKQHQSETNNIQLLQATYLITCAWNTSEFYSTLIFIDMKCYMHFVISKKLTF